MLLQLLFSNTALFALNIIAAFVFFSTGILYFDSAQISKNKRTPLLRCVGFFCLAAVSALASISIESPALALIAQIVKISGLGLILFSLTEEPILSAPGKKHAAVALPIPALFQSLVPLSGVLMALTALTYFRKVEEGLEKQLKPAGVAFLLLSVSELLRMAFFWSDTTSVYWSRFLAKFGPLWNIQHLFEFLGVVVLGAWVWGYIRFRVKLQVFVMTIGMSLVFLLTTTVFFTFMLLRNLENDALQHLKTDVKVLDYAVESLKERTAAQAKTVAQDSGVQTAFNKKDKKGLATLAAGYLSSQRASTLVIASTIGEVMVRAEDTSRTNDNVSTDPIIAAALKGQEAATIEYVPGIAVSEITVKAAVPMLGSGKAAGKVIGVVETGFVVDSTFVDGVKSVTGLDAAVFGKDKRVATTFLAPDGKSRFVGTIETNTNVVQNVLEKGEVYIGAATVLNQPFYTAYAPLKAYDGSIAGMLFVGKLQTSLIDTAKRSIDLTFLGSAALIMLSVIPAFFFARFLQEHAEA